MHNSATYNTVTRVALIDADDPPTASLREFREEIRAWLDTNLPPEWTERAFPENWPPGDEHPEAVEISRAWHHRLDEGGWLAPGWPVEHGGRGLRLPERVVVAEELAAARAPAPIGFSGVDILGPALIAHGTPEQRARFLPPILRGLELWCQGYSEPGSGSDLASMSTRAVADGDHYVVTGQKTWTSYGSRADWCFLLVRTGTTEARHRGITFLLAPMSTSGIEWRPTKQLLGDAHFGDLFLDEARVPRANVVGREGEGWQVAMHSLAHERVLSGNIVPLRTRLDALRRLAHERGIGPALRDRLARLEADLFAASRIQARALDLAAADDHAFGAWAAMVKLCSTELRQEISLAAAALLGPELAAGDDPDATAWRHELLDARAATIYAGTSEVQRNIIAEHGLGLPREPRP